MRRKGKHTKCNWVILLLLIIGIFFTDEWKVVANAAGTNFSITRGFTFEVSHNEADSPKLSDNNLNNYWEATDAAVSDAEFSVYLDGLFEVEKFQIFTATNTESGLYYHYDIYVSEDGNAWEKAVEYRETDSDGQNDITLTEAVQARYVKVKGVAAYTNGAAADDAFKIREFRVFGEEIGDIALHKNVTSSGDRSASSNTVDGNRTTYWESNKAANQKPYVIVELNGVYKLDSVNVINHWLNKDGRYYQFEIYASVDGENYTKVAEKTNTVSETVYGNTYTFEDDVFATYIKVVGTASSKNGTIHICDIRAYGTKIDYTALSNAVEANKARVEADYETETWPAFKSALTAAQTLLNNKNGTQEAVDAATKALTDAASALVEKPVDKTGLKALLDEAKAIDTNGASGGSVTSFNNAISAAQAVCDNANAKRAEVSEQVEALKLAIQAMRMEFSITRGFTFEVVGSDDGSTTTALLSNNNITNYWIGTEISNAEFLVDLDGLVHLDTIRILTSTDAVYEYKIQTSTDKSTWSDGVTIREDANGDSTYTFTDTTARFIKVSGIKAYDTTGGELSTAPFKVAECYVFGTEVDNIILGKNVTTNDAASNTSVARVMDEKRRTHWSSTNSMNAATKPYMIVDLEGVYKLSEVNVINYYHDDRYFNYEIYTSIGGEIYTLLEATNKTTGHKETIYGDDFKVSGDVYATHIKVVGINSNKDVKFNLMELRAYGTEVTDRDTLKKLGLVDTPNIARALNFEVSHNEADSSLLSDNKVNAYWEATGANVSDTWFLVDLHGRYLLDAFRMVTVDDVNYQYAIYVSEDKEEWSKVVSFTEASADNTHTTEGTIIGRYVKVVGIAGFDKEGTELNDATLKVKEFYVHGEEIGNIALNKPVSASCLRADGSSPASYMTDGDRATWWGSKTYTNDEPWIEVDLEEIYKLDSVNVVAYWFDPRYYGFDVYTSINGKDYTLVAKKDSNDIETVYGNTYDFDSNVYARYIKVMVTSNSANTSAHLMELRAYGELVTTGTQDEILAYKQNLQAVVDDCNARNNTEFSNESTFTTLTYTTYKSAMETAQQLLNSTSCTVDQLQLALDALKSADNNLEYIKVPKADGSYRVATLNTASHNHPDTERIKKVLLDRYNIDIVGFQEVDSFTDRIPYDMMTDFSDDGDGWDYAKFQKASVSRNGDYGIGMLSKIEFKEVSGALYNPTTTLGSDSDRAWQRVVITVKDANGNDVDVAVYNTHLSTNFYVRQDNKQEILDIMEKDPLEYVILVGDINCYTWERIEFLKDYNIAVFEGYDQIFTSRNLEVTNITCASVEGLSDHEYMVYLDFKILDEAKVDTIYLKTKITEAESLDHEDTYTESTYEPFTVALDNAKQVMEETQILIDNGTADATTQTAINNAAEELKQAMAGLVRLQENIAFNKTVTGDEPNAERPLSNITDGLMYSTWWVSNTPPATAIIDLEQIYDVSEFRIFPYPLVSGLRNYAYNIYFSNDGINYTKVISKGMEEAEYHLGHPFYFEGQTARYIKIEMVDGTDGSVLLSEVEVYGVTSTSVTASKEALAGLVEAYSAISGEDYVSESFEELTKALTSARQVVGEADVTLEEVQDALTNLENAYSALYTKDDLASCKEELQTLLTEYANIDLSSYTSDSAENFVEKYSEARTTYNDTDASLEEVKEGINALNLAHTYLVPQHNITTYLTYDVVIGTAKGTTNVLSNNKENAYWEAVDANASEVEFSVDLKGLYKIEGFKMVLPTDTSYDYDILVSEDGTTWIPAISYRGKEAGTVTHTLSDKLRASHIKVEVIAAYDVAGNPINTTFKAYEFYVYGTEVNNIALWKPVVTNDTSYSPNATYYPFRVLDGDRAINHWSSGYYPNKGTSPYITIDLQGVYKLENINVIPYWGTNRWYQYEIWGSIDGVNYTKLAEKKDEVVGTVYGFDYAMTDTVYVSYLKLVGTATSLDGNNNDVKFHVRELRAYGTEILYDDLYTTVTELKYENRSKYTTETWENFAEVYAEAVELLTEKKSSQDEVDAMVTKLRAAATALEAKEIEPEATPEPTPKVIPPSDSSEENTPIQTPAGTTDEAENNITSEQNEDSAEAVEGVPDTNDRNNLGFWIVTCMLLAAMIVLGITKHSWEEEVHEKN